MDKIILYGMKWHRIDLCISHLKRMTSQKIAVVTLHDDDFVMIMMMMMVMNMIMMLITEDKDYVMFRAIIIMIIFGKLVAEFKCQ